MAQGRNLREVGDRIEALLEEIRALSDPPTRDRAEELVRLLVELYGAGLERVAEVLAEQGPSGQELLATLAEDPLVGSLLVLHGLHPVPVEARVRQALDRVRPYLGSHAGGVELLGLDPDGVVRLRLQGSCHGCPSSTVTVTMAIEQAILEAAPEVTRVEVEGVAEPSRAPLIQVGPLRRGAPAAGDGGGGWVPVEDPGPLLPGETRALELRGVPVLLCSARGSLYAYRDSCPGCGSGLAGGSLQGEWLACPSCGRRYDVCLAGRSEEGRDLHLDPLPLLSDERGVRVALPAEREVREVRT